MDFCAALSYWRQLRQKFYSCSLQNVYPLPVHWESLHLKTSEGSVTSANLFGCVSDWTPFHPQKQSPVHRNHVTLRPQMPQCLILFPLGREALQTEVVCSPLEQQSSQPLLAVHHTCKSEILLGVFRTLTMQTLLAHPRDCPGSSICPHTRLSLTSHNTGSGGT